MHFNFFFSFFLQMKIAQNKLNFINESSSFIVKISKNVNIKKAMVERRNEMVNETQNLQHKY